MFSTSFCFVRFFCDFCELALLNLISPPLHLRRLDCGYHKKLRRTTASGPGAAYITSWTKGCATAGPGAFAKREQGPRRRSEQVQARRPLSRGHGSHGHRRCRCPTCCPCLAAQLALVRRPPGLPHPPTRRYPAATAAEPCLCVVCEASWARARGPTAQDQEGGEDLRGRGVSTSLSAGAGPVKTRQRHPSRWKARGARAAPRPRLRAREGRG